MRSDAQRIAKYIAKTTPTTVGLKVAEMLTGMNSNFADATTSMVAKETQIQGILNGKGTVPTIQYPFYLSFGRELHKRQIAGIDGDGLVSFAVTICAKYVGYGLVEATLQDIALDVFGITIP